MLARRHLPPGFVVGINIGRAAATDPADAVADYVEAYRLVAPVADYVAVNVSSPNTHGLRELQQPERLVALLEALAAEAMTIGCRRPLLVKIAPDLADEAIDALLGMLPGSPAGGLILTNTTIGRDGLTSPLGAEAGGLSGVPLRDRMLSLVSRARAHAGDALAIVASGGISSAEDVRAAYDAGADLVQLWTGLVYRGPGLIGEAARVTRDRPDTMRSI
jgi:dihydroorotate dehydrogenase